MFVLWPIVYQICFLYFILSIIISILINFWRNQTGLFFTAIRMVVKDVLHEIVLECWKLNFVSWNVLKNLNQNKIHILISYYRILKFNVVVCEQLWVRTITIENFWLYWTIFCNYVRLGKVFWYLLCCKFFLLVSLFFNALNWKSESMRLLSRQKKRWIDRPNQNFQIGTCYW